MLNTALYHARIAPLTFSCDATSSDKGVSDEVVKSGRESGPKDVIKSSRNKPYDKRVSAVRVSIVQNPERYSQLLKPDSQVRHHLPSRKVADESLRQRATPMSEAESL